MVAMLTLATDCCDPNAFSMFFVPSTSAVFSCLSKPAADMSPKICNQNMYLYMYAFYCFFSLSLIIPRRWRRRGDAGSVGRAHEVRPDAPCARTHE